MERSVCPTSHPSLPCTYLSPFGNTGSMPLSGCSQRWELEIALRLLCGIPISPVLASSKNWGSPWREHHYTGTGIEDAFFKGIFKRRNGHSLMFSDWIQYKQAKFGAIHSLNLPSNNRTKKKTKTPYTIYTKSDLLYMNKNKPFLLSCKKV